MRGAHPRRARASRPDGDDRLRRQPGGPQLLARSLRRAPVLEVPAHLLVGHRRPVAEERHLRAHVREPVEDPDARLPAHRLPRDHGRQPAGVRRLALACPDVLGEIDAIRRAAARSIVVDPRRTGTVDHATEWLPIRPGTDAAFLLALVPRAVRRGPGHAGRARRQGRRPRRGSHRWSKSSPPSRSRPGPACPAETTRRIARDFAATPRAAVYGRIGLCNQEFGTLASWLVDVVNLITGHFDVEGGLMWGKPVSAPLAWLQQHRRDRRAGRSAAGTPACAAHPRCSVRCRRRASPRRSRPRATGRSSCSSPSPRTRRSACPTPSRLDEALPMLDCLIAIDNYVNETTRHAHVILPGVSPLESPHLDELIWGWAVRSAVKWSDALYALPEGARRRVGDRGPARLAARAAAPTPTSTCRRSTTAGSRRSAA